MNAVKKAIKVIAILLALVVLFEGIMYLFFKPLFYHFFYPFDRITGTVCITIDGKQYDLKRTDVVGRHDSGKEIGTGFRKTADGAKLSIRGGEYGPYTLTIHVDGVNTPLEVMIYQYNWHNVVKFHLDISIDSAAETITYTSTATVNGSRSAEERSTAISFSDSIFHSIVSS